MLVGLIRLCYPSLLKRQVGMLTLMGVLPESFYLLQGCSAGSFQKYFVLSSDTIRNTAQRD